MNDNGSSRNERSDLLEILSDAEDLYAATTQRVLASHTILTVSRDSQAKTLELPPVPDSEATFYPNQALTQERKFEIREELGRGGMGRVLAAFDKDIGRTVALKTFIDAHRAGPRDIQKLLREVQITGQLEHPNIIPIYTVGRLEDGNLFLAMKRIQGQTLKSILGRLRSGDLLIRKQYPLTKRLAMLLPMLNALEYAHSRGVLHRDLKPENVMVGDFGEVLVMDWGLSLVGRTRKPAALAVHTEYDLPVKDGMIVGTPAYMSPEQARGKITQIDERTDVYLLGGILYELLTFTPPITAPAIMDAIDEVLLERIESPRLRAPEEDIPLELDEITMRALAPRKEDRYPDVASLREAVQAYLEGSLQAERRAQQADEFVREANGRRDLYKVLKERLGRLRKRMDEALAVEGQHALEQRQAMWSLQDEHAELSRQMTSAFSEMTNTYHAATQLVSSHKVARAHLAEIYWQRMLESEFDGDEPMKIYWENLVRRYNDGKYDDLLRGEGKAELSCEQAGSTVSLYQYTERNRVLEALPILHHHTLPLVKHHLPRGSYLAEVSAPGMATARVPFFVERARVTRKHIHLVDAETVGDGFIPICGGNFPMGGDPQTFGSGPLKEVHVPDFALARFPVTMEEYLEFLNDIAEKDGLEKALAHSPRQHGSNESFLEVTQEGRVRLCENDAEGDVWEESWPVLAVNYHDALAYTSWRSQRDGVSYRLPTSEEWEKAARGADRRRYVWGNQFDDSFANTRFSHGPRPLMKPVGHHPLDQSPYGVCDMAGNIRDWCSTIHDTATGSRTVRGGAWSMFEMFSRCAYQGGGQENLCSVTIGFRLAKDLPEQNNDT